MSGATSAPPRTQRASLEPDPVLRGRPGDLELTDQLLAPLWRPARLWWFMLAGAALATGLLVLTVVYTVTTGIGVWGNNIPVAWGFAIINFVWWIGLGHAGTFISAILLLLNQRWRTSINRIAEAMTLFALVNAALFPLLHLGRPWFFYWLIPYPSTMEVWPQFRSALPWDLVAVFTYSLISLLFWYLGLIPDLATARDRAVGRLRRRIYGVFALGWNGSSREVDAAFADAWETVGRDAIGIWQDALLPRLARLGQQRRRWLPWPLRVGLYFLALVLLAIVVYLFLGGRGGPPTTP